ncbi:hypothetical protein DRN67_04360 [Candidatus Micrarchaeota archaeon]|nr:MAG: hypothetical protein DRN67_04360 [Candidatus Micrarchaeota archaeon]
MQGIFYSGITILLVTLIALHVVSYMEAVRSQGEQMTVRIRTNELGNFVDSMALDMPRVVDISTRRALVAAINEVDLRGAGLDDAQLRLQELVMNGTIYGLPSYWLNASTVPDWADRVAGIGANKGFTVNFTFESFEVLPEDSFSVRAVLNWEVNVSDSVEEMSVYRSYETSVRVPITALEDPFYPLHTRGLAHNKIIPANFTVINVTLLDRMITERVYLNSSEGPSFLDRLEDNFVVPSKYNGMTDNQIGLESIVNIQEFINYGVEIIQNKTNVDYIYFSDINMTGYPVNGSAYTWLRIDPESAQRYGVNGSLIQ